MSEHRKATWRKFFHNILGYFLNKTLTQFNSADGHFSDDDLYIEMPQFGDNDKLDWRDITLLPALNSK